MYRDLPEFGEWPAHIAPYNKHDEAFCADPYPTFHYLRAQRPVAPMAHLNAWVVTKAADVAAALKNSALGHRDEAPLSSAPGELPTQVAALHQLSSEMMRLWIVMRNPPDQTRLHAVLAPHFVARRLDAPVAAARATARAAIAQMPAGQRFELLARVLIPSAQAAADTFLNVSHRDGVRLSQLSHRADRFVDQDVDPLTTAAGVMAHVGLVEMLATLLKQPARQSSELVAGLQRAAATGKISEREAVANLLLIAIAAYVNVSRQLANCIAALLTDPAQWPLLAAAPQRAAVALEEATRYESTTLTILRRARTDTQIGAQPIRSGELVMLGAAAANRDPALHADPDRLDLNRPSVRHWTFGAGMHFCLGAALSRQVGRVVLEELAVALPALTLAAPVRYEPSYIKRIPAELWVVGCAP